MKIINLKLDLYYDSKRTLVAIGVFYNGVIHCTGDIRKWDELSFVLSSFTEEGFLLDSMERCVKSVIYIKRTIESKCELLYDSSREHVHLKPLSHINTSI